MPILVMGSPKGGAGKTTTTVGLAVAFTRAGLTVGVVDGDPQQHVATWLQVYADANGVAFAEADPEWSYADITVARSIFEDSMVATIADLGRRYDIVLVDTQGSANQAMLMAVSQASLVIVPVQPSRFDVGAAVKTARIVKQASLMVSREIPLRLMLSRTKPTISTKATKTVRAELAEAGLPMLAGELMDRTIFQTMTISGLPPSPTSKNEAERNAAANLEALASEIVGVMQKLKEPV